MNTAEIIVHRGNSPVNTADPFDQVSYYAEQGFQKIEVDIYAISETTFKFCHPVDADRIASTHTLHDGFLEKLVAKFPNIMWFVDLKCLDLDNIPMELLQFLVGTFKDTDVFTAAQHEILELAHSANHPTAQYFKDNTESTLNYTPEFFILDDRQDKTLQQSKTLVFCPDSTTALTYIADGFAGAIVDGDKLIKG